MKVIIKRVKKKIDIKGIKKVMNELPQEFYLFLSSQYLPYRDELINILKKEKKVFLYKPRHASIEGQILGCSIEKLDKPVVVISDGLFHGEAMLLAENKVIIVDPNEWKITKTLMEKIEKIKNYTKAMQKQFYYSEKIGIIVSTKIGQEWLMLAEKVKKCIEQRYKDKKAYIFIGNNVSIDRLMDYNYIELWINTACPRIIDDAIHSSIKLINVKDFLEIEKCLENQ